MTTLVGTQADFSSAIKELVELEYDAIGAYELAIEKLENLTYKNKLSEFLADHRRHISEIQGFYSGALDLPTSADLIKGSLAKLKVSLGNMFGSDISILRAMLTNEKDTNMAYERMNVHPELPDNTSLSIILKSAYEDEIRHKAWLEAETSTFGNIG